MLKLILLRDFNDELFNGKKGWQPPSLTAESESNYPAPPTNERRTLFLSLALIKQLRSFLQYKSVLEKSCPPYLEIVSSGCRSYPTIL